MKHDKKLFLKQIVWIVLIVCGVGVLGQLAYSSYSLWKKQDIAYERQEYLKTLEQDQITLKNSLSQSLGAGYIEQEARNKLGLAKPGETVVIMPDASAGGSQISQPNLPQSVDTIPNWKKWWELFF
jgi:cell division protein FtsB